MSASSAEYRIDLGGTIFSLRCRPDAFAGDLAAWFQRPSATGQPHICLDLEIVPHTDSPQFPTSLVTTKTLTPNGGFDIGDGLFSGHFDPATGTGTIRAKEVLTQGPLRRILEQIFYQAFWSARAAAGAGSFLIHSSAVIAGGLGFLFVGPSEAGKSTVAKLSRAHHVLGDEMNLIVPGKSGLRVVGTLFNGLFQEKRAGEAPLAGVFLLKQAPQHALTAVPLIEAVVALAAEIVPPVGLNESPTRDTLPAMMDLAESLASGTTIKVLEFLPDDGFWPVIGAEFGFQGGR